VDPLFLEMVVQGRHQKNAFSFAEPFTGVLEVGHLYHYAQVLDQKDPAEHRDQ
jgi:hypothetical protein